MSALVEWERSRRVMAQFKSWLSLVGKEYFGGTRGQGGEYGQFVDPHLSVSIYHQAYDGATNYHEPGAEQRRAINKAVAKHLPAIMLDAEAILAEDVKSKAVMAAKEAEIIMSDAARKEKA